MHSISAMLAKQKAAEDARLSALLPSYANLPICNSWGDCTSCGKEDNRECYIATKEGKRVGVICDRCGTKMKHGYDR
jgi:hypothetical protein